MNIEKYLFISKDNHQAFAFNSCGPKGTIKKVVLFSQINEWDENIYNLSFGDWDEIKQEIDDKVISNNGDREKVLATVAATVLEFSKHFPKTLIYVKGSTESRTRLYQIGISNYLGEINEFFDIYGFRNGDLEKFRTGRTYEAFFIILNK